MIVTPRTGHQHAAAAVQALFVTFLWSTSWVLIKVGLDDLHLAPLSFAGLRYALAAIILLPFGIRAISARGGERPSPGILGAVAGYGLLFVTVAQGAQFLALAALPATAVSLVLASIPAVVALLALLGSRERAGAVQIGGIGVLAVGAALYFGPFQVPVGGELGLVAAVACVLAAAASSHLGRRLARDARDVMGGPIGITTVGMVVGGAALLIAGVATEGWPTLDARGWLIVTWLAVVNTAVAFTLWNHTLATLTAVESSVINNTMTVQIACLAIVFLGERLVAVQLVGLLLAAAGAVLVQLAPHLSGRRVGPLAGVDQDRPAAGQ